jgi:hypothetical protein
MHNDRLERMNRILADAVTPNSFNEYQCGQVAVQA